MKTKNGKRQIFLLSVIILIFSIGNGSVFASGVSSSTFFTVIPEPATLAILAFGLTFFGRRNNYK